MSIASILDTSKRGIQASESAIDVTANNIANVNTPGYTRRTATFSQLKNGKVKTFGSVSGSSKSEEITRSRNRFIDEQYLNQNHSFSKYSSYANLYSQIEDIFAEPKESGLSNHISELWDSWSDLAANPESQAARIIVSDKAVALEKTFNRINSELIHLKEDIAIGVRGNVDDINSRLKLLQSINIQIASNNSDDLLDQRDRIVSELSDFMEIKTKEGDHGEMTVTTGGQILVSFDTLNMVEVETVSQGNTTGLIVKLTNSKTPLDIQSGEIGSLLNINNKMIPDYLTKLDVVAKSIAEEVNAIHYNGYDLNGNTNINFFNDNINGAGNFKVNAVIKGDPSYIASSNMLEESGNAIVAQAISDIQLNEVINGNSIGEYYDSLVTDIGTNVQKYNNLRDSQEIIVRTIQNQQDSKSGVSLDEELVNLTQYEQGYQAAAKVVGVVQELVDTILMIF